MNLIEALTNGHVMSESGIPQHISTAISDIFVFQDLAYKIYKSDNELFNKNFNDISSAEKRFQFTKKDFEWNNRLSPEIYIELRGARIEGDKAVFVEETNAEEMVIVMNKVDMTHQVVKLLVSGGIKIGDCYEIGRQFGEREIKMPKPQINLTAYEDFKLRAKDIKPWMEGVKEIPQEEGMKYLEFVKNFIEEHKVDLDVPDKMGLCLDVHSDNAIFENSKYLPIDSYAPKEAWLYGFININIYRVATDFYVFLGKEAFDEVIRGYQHVTQREIDRTWDKFLVLYSELIVWPYQYMLLSDKEPWRKYVAEKHHEFLQSFF